MITIMLLVLGFVLLVFAIIIGFALFIKIFLGIIGFMFDILDWIWG